jgi:hypothetical protein
MPASQVTLQFLQDHLHARIFYVLNTLRYKKTCGYDMFQITSSNLVVIVMLQLRRNHGQRRLDDKAKGPEPLIKVVLQYPVARRLFSLLTSQSHMQLVLHFKLHTHQVLC